MANTFLLSRFVSARNAGLLAWLHGWARVLHFAGEVLAAALSPSLYNRVTRTATARQIYFTAWQILPAFTLFTAALAALLVRITVTVAAAFGLSDEALGLIVRVLVLELVPLAAVLVVALRSGSAIVTEIAMMRVSDELEALRRSGVDPLRFELIPRVLATALSVIALIAVNCAAALAIAYLGVYGFTLWGFAPFTHVVGQVFDLQVAAGFALKCLLFGLAVAVIPISEGLATPQRADAVPLAVLQGMMKLFLAIAVLEVGLLIAKYI
ncbi:MAG TPA: ABC transporter permease [Burkholderiales bacterium]